MVENVLTLSGIELVDSFYCPVYLRNPVGFPWVDMYLSTVSIRTCTYTNLVGYPRRTKRGIVIRFVVLSNQVLVTILVCPYP